ncbi:hypothetical protein ALC56_15166, partial [Trachymyrmex septentrionalis]
EISRCSTSMGFAVHRRGARCHGGACFVCVHLGCTMSPLYPPSPCFTLASPRPSPSGRAPGESERIPWPPGPRPTNTFSPPRSARALQAKLDRRSNLQSLTSGQVAVKLPCGTFRQQVYLPNDSHHENDERRRWKSNPRPPEGWMRSRGLTERGFFRQPEDRTRSILTHVTTTPTKPTATNYEGGGGAINNGNIKGLSDLSRPPTSGATSDTWSDDAVMSTAKCTRVGVVHAHDASPFGVLASNVSLRTTLRGISSREEERMGSGDEESDLYYGKLGYAAKIGRRKDPDAGDRIAAREQPEHAIRQFVTTPRLIQVGLCIEFTTRKRMVRPRFCFKARANNRRITGTKRLDDRFFEKNAIDVLEEGGGWRCMRVDCMKRARELFLLLRRCRSVVDEKWQRRGDGRTDMGEISFECKTKRRGSSLTIGGSCVDTRAHPPRFCSALSSFRCPSPESRKKREEEEEEEEEEKEEVEGEEEEEEEEGEEEGEEEELF